MLQALAPHGPDAVASFPNPATASADHTVALGHRLLRTTPEDAFELQPLVLPNEAWLVADARIDNRADLASALDLESTHLPTTPDSLFVLRAWQRWGEDCVQHLTGSFAFAVWQPRRERFVLARDHSGDRPLYFRKTPNSFLFATSARAIRQSPGVSSELDDQQLARDLVGLPPEYPKTRFREIGMLAPGHYLTVDRSSVQHLRHWRIFSLPETRFHRDEDYASRFREIFDQAVGCRLRTTGAVASELSAGLDSAAVTATAAHLLGATGNRLTAYTAVPRPEFRSPAPAGFIVDEGPFAAEVAALYPNIRHVRVDSTNSDMLRELARIFPLLDLPHAAALNSVWSNLILDHAAASGVTVMLSGALGNFAASYTGGDLLRTLSTRRRFLQTARTAWRMRRMGISSGRNAASQTIFAVLPWPLRRTLDPLIRGTHLRWSALRADSASRNSLLDDLRRSLFTQSSLLPRLMEGQFQLNQYGDYNAATLAGWRIDVRDPTSDRRVFEFCASIPPEQFIVGNQGRSLIRRAMRERLPESTLTRTQQGIQAADFYESLTPIRAHLAAELALLKQSPGARRLIDLDLLHSALEHWPATAAEAARQAGSYQSAIPRGFAVGYFIRRVEAESAASPQPPPA